MIWSSFWAILRRYFRRPSAEPQAVVADANEIKPESKPATSFTPISPERRAQRKRMRQFIKQRVALADEIDRLLTRIGKLATSEFTDKLGRSNAAELAADLFGSDFAFMGEQVGELELTDHKLMVLNPRNPSHEEKHDLSDLVEMFWPIDCATIVRKPEDKCYFVERIYSVEPKAVRGKVRFIVPRMVRSIYGHLHDDGSWLLSEGYFGFINHKWRPIDVGIERVERETANGQLIGYKANHIELRNEIHDSTAIAFSFLLTQRYEWHVALGYDEEGPRCMLPTSPRGCAAFFKDRDVTEGRSRRAALRHWVIRHYRESISDGLTFVREHLRGENRFKWYGLNGEILVSAYDLERNENFRLEAAHWRAMRKHNRFKFRLRRKAIA